MNRIVARVAVRVRDAETGGFNIRPQVGQKTSAEIMTEF